MAINIKSLHARLLNLSREKRVDFQVLLNRLGAEQFLFRLSKSRYAADFIFKGGSLLSYIIDTERKTKDLDFSVKTIGNNTDKIKNIIQTILNISVDDGFEWKEVDTKELEHPDLDYPGVRVRCKFLLGNMRGNINIDIAFDHSENSTKETIHRMRYKDKPFFGNDFMLLAYSPESIFAEKFHIIISKRALNTRMKDYYDINKLIDHGLKKRAIKRNTNTVFKNRNTPLITQVDFSKDEISQLEEYWKRYCAKERLLDAPKEIVEIVDKLDNYIKAIYEK